MKARPVSKSKKIMKAKPAKARKKAVRKASTPVAPPAARVTSKALASGYQWVNAYLTVRDVQAAIDFYQNAFGFVLRLSVPGPEGKLMHAELMHKDSLVMLGPENPSMGALAPQGQSPVTLYTYVENVDEIASRASSNGAMLIKPPTDEFWGDRCAIIVDPHGHSWMFATHVKDVYPEDMHP